MEVLAAMLLAFWAVKCMTQELDDVIDAVCVWVLCLGIALIFWVMWGIPLWAALHFIFNYHS